MKSCGDLTQEERDFMEDLEDEENLCDVADISDGKKAQVYTCLAHDWFQLSMEEEGHRLLLKANKIFPGYFKSLVVQHSKEDECFAQIVNRITLILLLRISERNG